MDTVYKKALLAVIITLCGITAGAIFAGDSSGAIIYSDPFVNSGGFDSLVNNAQRLCASAFIQAALIFISGFTIIPLAVDIPIFALRGFATGYAAAYLNLSDTRSVTRFASYLLITLLLIPLFIRAASFRSNLKEARIRKTAAFTYCFLMISGASVLIKILPIYITGILK